MSDPPAPLTHKSATERRRWNYFRPTGVRSKLATIPILFVLLIMVTFAYTGSNVLNKESRDWLTHAHNIQIRMARAFVDDVLLASIGYPRPYEDDLRSLQANTLSLLDGGEVLASRWQNRVIKVSGTQDAAIRSKLEEQLDLIEKMKVAASEVLTDEPNSPAYALHVQELTTESERFRVLSSMIIIGMIDESSLQNRYILWVEMVVSLLVIALGVLLTRQVAESQRVLQDEITERERAEKALQASEKQLKSLFDTANDAILLASEDMKIMLHNARTGAIFGYQSADLDGASLDMLINPRDVDLQRRYLQSKLNREHSHYAGGSFEATGIHRDGTQFAVEVSLASWDMDDQADQRYYTVLIRDVSERKATEDKLALLSESNQALEHYTLIASHDLQEPLRKVLVYTDMLKVNYADEVSPDARKYIDNIQDSSRRMQQLISALLSYSRVSTQGRSFVETDLNATVAQSLADLEWLVTESKAQVTVGPLPTVEADPVQMRQLFQNILSNALKYGKPNQPPMVNVEGRVLEDLEVVDMPPEYQKISDCYCQITVTDNGIGFDEKYLDRIFKVFQRLHGRKEYYGTGIGLAICRKIVERHGGFILASSKPDEGATFTVTLPVRHQSPGPEQAELERETQVMERF